jgi:hypothetical protein
LKEVPNGSAGEVTAVFKNHLTSEIRTLDEPQKAGTVQALASFTGLSNQQLAACFPGFALLSERKWGDKASLAAPPEACHGLFDVATYRAMSELLDKVMKLALQDAPNGASASDLLKAFQARLQSTAKSESAPEQIAVAISTLFDRLNPSDVETCVPVLAPFRERLQEEATSKDLRMPQMAEAGVQRSAAAATEVPGQKQQLAPQAQPAEPKSAAATSEDEKHWFENYVVAHGGCGSFFQRPHNFSDVWSPSSAVGTVNYVASSVEQGRIEVELFGKNVLEWTDDDIESARGVFHDCAEKIKVGGGSAAQVATQVDYWFERQVGDIILKARKLDAQRRAQRLHQQAELDKAAADEARGYKRITIETFVLDAKELAAKAAQVSLGGVYIREGNIDFLYADTRAVMMASHQALQQPKVPLLTDDATREFRQHLLMCRSNPGSARLGCSVTALGRVTTCTSNAFGGRREEPCLAVEEGRQSSGPMTNLVKKSSIRVLIILGLIVVLGILVFKVQPREAIPPQNAQPQNGTPSSAVSSSTSCDLRCLRNRYGDSAVWRIESD